jgi:transcriptional regulator with XRE-family HTH domain
MLKPEQLRMALAGLEWTVRQLAEKAGVNPNTVSRLATTGGVQASSMEKIQRALEAAGIDFLPDGGVRLKTAEGGQ